MPLTGEPVIVRRTAKTANTVAYLVKAYNLTTRGPGFSLDSLEKFI